MADTEWPYDADQHDPLTALRIPVVRSPVPDKAYLAVVLAETDNAIWPCSRPTDAEAAMIASYIGYLCSDYRPGWRKAMLERPFDLDGAMATRVFRKRPDGGWCYRLDTWQYGPFWAPPDNGDPANVLDLEAVLDRLVTYDAKMTPQPWLDWKAAHPEAFGEDQPDAC